MENHFPTHTFAKPQELEQTFNEIRSQSVLLVLAGFVLLGLFSIFSASKFPDMLQGGTAGLLLFGFALCGWYLRKYRISLAGWFLSFSCLFIAWLVTVWSGNNAFLSLLFVPVGLAVAFIGMRAGFYMVLCVTISLLWLPLILFPRGIAGQFMAIAAVWIMYGLTWLALRPFATITTWSWANYELNRDLLEQVRNANLQAQEALKDLSDANLQLRRLNDLAHSLQLSAEEARKAKEQFVANVSHELRTPLNMIIGFSEMIMQTPKEIYGSRISTKLLADLDVILRNSRHLAKLIDDVLDLSQVDAGKMALSKSQCSISEVIQAAVVSVQPLFQSKNLYLNVACPDDLPVIYCDATRIKQVILNLLSNAARFTEHGGVSIKVACDQSWMTVRVTDTGPGIPTESKDQLFQPFHQMDASIRSAYGGSGLGLSICKRFIEMHDGRIGFESEVSKGSTFYFQLPIATPVDTTFGLTRWVNPYGQFEPRTHPFQAPIPPKRPRFIVVENGHALQRLLNRYMDQVEFEAVVSIEQALQAFVKQPAQALLVNGLSVDNALRNMDAVDGLPVGIPVIICSIPGIEHAAGLMGVSDYLIKPISRDTLITTLERIPSAKHMLLIADDEEDIARLFRRMLMSSSLHYNILKANNGEEALNLLREKHPDVILLDLFMPKMDGFQLLEEKGKDPSIRDIPVIIISARDPTGQPIVSKYLAFTNSGGLSLTQVLESIRVISAIFSQSS
jgi:signal transduction histidine kinase/CheY-like chemotaxis protein